MPTEIIIPGWRELEAIPSPHNMTEEQKTSYWKAIDRSRRNWIAKIARRVSRRFREEYNAILRAFTEGSTPEEGLLNIEAELEAQRAEWERLLDTTHEDVTRAFAPAARRRVGIHYDPLRTVAIGQGPKIDWHTRVERYLRGRSAEKVTGIIDKTKKQIRNALADGFAEGEGIYKLSQRLEKLELEQIIPHRSEVIARTETMYAADAGSHYGALAEAEALGAPTNKEWIATRDDRTRGYEARDEFDHVTADGQVRSLWPEDEPYEVSGEQLLFPLDDSLGASPGNIIQCRCTEGYIVQD